MENCFIDIEQGIDFVDEFWYNYNFTNGQCVHYFVAYTKVLIKLPERASIHYASYLHWPWLTQGKFTQIEIVYITTNCIDV